MCFDGSWAPDEQVGEFSVGDFPAKGVLEVKLAPYALSHASERVGSDDGELGKNRKCRD